MTGDWRLEELSRPKSIITTGRELIEVVLPVSGLTGGGVVPNWRCQGRAYLP